jgi:hypothetical protein
MRMARETDSTSEPIPQLEAPVTLTPDQIAEAAGGAAAAALSGPGFPIICGGIWGPVIPMLTDMAPMKAV